MKSASNILFWIFLSYIFIYVFCKRFAGPYDLIFKSAYKCENLGEDIFGYTTKLYKVNRTHNLYNSTISCPRGIVDTMAVTVEFSVYSNGRWKDNFLHIKLNRACSDLIKMFPGLLESIVEAAEQEFHGCPVPPGDLDIKEWIFNIRFAMNAFPYGTYKAVATVWDQETILTCFTLEIAIVPKDT